MTRTNHSIHGLILLAAATMLAGCEGPGAEVAPQPPSDNERAALEKAEAMIEENRDRLESEESGDNDAGSEQ